MYIMAIVAANVITAAFAPLIAGPMVIPYGTFLIGVTFILRDLVQHHFGRMKTYGVIVIALVCSAISSYLLGDTLYIVFASSIAFILSESSDTEIYSRLSLPMAWRVWWSGLVGGLLDSVVFVVIGLSPLGAGMVPWEAVPMAILSQILVKTALQGCGALIVKGFPGMFPELH
ncbi:VUT family protein [Heliobacterium chlorum]|uniref:VUT family protein n=2 Tax=Heliobacterium chlorum TaxID=2698 RepID=A0ABR7T6U6_HELCL|nr:VUT family protein [Heliobacterium chlorum]